MELLQTKVVARSSTAATIEVTWVKHLVEDIVQKINISINIILNPIQYGWEKHIEINV